MSDPTATRAPPSLLTSDGPALKRAEEVLAQWGLRLLRGARAVVEAVHDARSVRPAVVADRMMDLLVAEGDQQVEQQEEAAAPAAVEEQRKTMRNETIQDQGPVAQTQPQQPQPQNNTLLGRHLVGLANDSAPLSLGALRLDHVKDDDAIRCRVDHTVSIGTVALIMGAMCVVVVVAGVLWWALREDTNKLVAPVAPM